jgi:hypothetical protein
MGNICVIRRSPVINVLTAREKQIKEKKKADVSFFLSR